MTIKNKAPSLAVVVGAVAALASLPVAAIEQGDWLIGGGLTYVKPNSSSTWVKGIPNSEVRVDNNTRPSFTVTYMVTDNIGVQLLGSFPFKHDLEGAGSISGLNKIGDVKHLPPTLTAQWYFLQKTNPVRPYVGLGVNYTYFWDENASSSLENALGGPVDLDIDNSWGLAGQVGMDVEFHQNWFMNVDVRYISIKGDTKIKAPGFNSSVDVNIDPWIISAGVGYRF